MQEGFLGAGGTFAADMNLVAQLVFAGMLVLGFLLARAKRFGVHRCVQSTVVLANLVLIGAIMIPSFHRSVRGHAAEAFHDSYYGWAWAHVVLGIVTQALALYVLLCAGTKLIPETLRMQRWKPWMRTTLALWLVTVAVGAGTYRRWYALEKTAVAAAAPAAPAAGTVHVSNFKFEPKELTVKAGTTVTWINDGGKHTLVADDGSFSKPDFVAGGKHTHTFAKAGTYPYFCSHHGGKGGELMAGKIIVTP